MLKLTPPTTVSPHFGCQPRLLKKGLNIHIVCNLYFGPNHTLFPCHFPLILSGVSATMPILLYKIHVSLKCLPSAPAKVSCISASACTQPLQPLTKFTGSKYSSHFLHWPIGAHPRICTTTCRWWDALPPPPACRGCSD